MTFKRTHWLVGLMVALLATLIASACASGKAEDVDIRIAGAPDVLPLLKNVEEPFFEKTGYTIGYAPVEGRMEALKKGAVDLVLLGREPKPEELEGMRDVVAAYDAVVLVVSDRSYFGGEQWRIQGDVILKVKKFDGLQELSKQDLVGHFTNMLKLNQEQEMWLPASPYFTFHTRLDLGGLIVDPESDPLQYKGSWHPAVIGAYGWMYQPGIFDTQTLILEQLGLAEPDPENEEISKIARFIESEEEIISLNYKIDPELKTPISWEDFDLLIGHFSRQVVIRAQQHGFAIQALRIEGIDPIREPEAIYNGSYPFSRKIHVMGRAETTPAAEALVEFLLSPEGQKTIAEMEFLPLPVEP